MLPDRWERIARKNEPLAAFTSIGIGGPAKRLIEISDPDDLPALARDMAFARVPWRLLGGGSNVLVDDAGCDELVVVFRTGGQTIKVEDELITAAGGVSLKDLVDASVRAGLADLSFAAGIPGTVGGAVYGNAGAFGLQLGDILESALLMDKNGKTFRHGPSELDFAYRRSNLKTSGHVLLEASFRLKAEGLSAEQSERDGVRARIREILALRKSKHPDPERTPSAGSFFKNLEPTSAADRRQAAGAFLEQVGAKEMKVGQAAVFHKHANIIINRGGASCADILELARSMRRAVQERFGLSLEREVIIWPEELARDLPGD